MLRRMVLIVLILLLSGCTSEQPDSASRVISASREGVVTLAMGGDTMLDDLALPWIKKYGYDYPLREVAGHLRAADIAVVNLEVPVTDNCQRRSKKYSYKMEPEGLDALAAAGVDLVCLANNHALDCGPEGLQSTISLLEKRGIGYVGAGMSADEARRGLVYDVSGTRVGFLAYYSYRSQPDGPSVATINEEGLSLDIRRLRQRCDVLVVQFHWGDNYKFRVDDKQSRFGRRAIDLGADMVVGHHPHIYQAAELYRGKPIVYSLGNFAFGTGNNSARDGLLLWATIEQKRLTEVRLIPLFIQNRSPEVLFQTRLHQGPAAKRVLARLAKASSDEFGTKIRIAEDQGVLRLD